MTLGIRLVSVINYHAPRRPDRIFARLYPAQRVVSGAREISAEKNRSRARVGMMREVYPPRYACRTLSLPESSAAVPSRMIFPVSRT